jgi:glycerate 2-kinase
LVVTKDGHGELLPWPVHEAGHPQPDARSLAAGDALMRFIATLPPDARVLVVLSGGASALVECLPSGVDMERLQRINDWLLGSGLDIHQVNRVRKRLSLIKGGRLAQRLAPHAVRCLAISDVPGDDPRAIGSGPLVADTALDAAPAAGLPEFVQEALDKAPPPPAPGDACFERVEMQIVACLDDARQAAAAAARRHGYEARLGARFIAGDAVVAGVELARELLAADVGIVHVWGGETTVTLPARPGRGGRNQSLALAAALELGGCPGAHFLSAGTDGTDGPTQDAGALVDHGSVARGALQGVDAREALRMADAGTFLEASGDLVQTGPTGTNVMDLMVGVVEVGARPPGAGQST